MIQATSPLRHLRPRRLQPPSEGALPGCGDSCRRQEAKSFHFALFPTALSAGLPVRMRMACSSSEDEDLAVTDLPVAAGLSIARRCPVEGCRRDGGPTLTWADRRPRIRRRGRASVGLLAAVETL